jgi:integrase
MKLHEAIPQFLADPTAGLNTASSRNGYRRVLRMLPDKDLGRYTENDLVNLCGQAHLAPSTRAGYRTKLAGFFSWAVWKGYVKTDPAANLKRLVPGSHTNPVRDHHWYTAVEVTEILEGIDTSTTNGLRDMIILRLGFTVGLRRAEIAELLWDQVDLDRDAIFLRGKGGKLATVFIPTETRAWLEKWQTNQAFPDGIRPSTKVIPVGIDMVGRIVARYGLRPHDLRRSYAGMLEEIGYPLESISAALRHSNLTTTQRYLQRRQDAAFQAVSKRGLDV